MPQIPGVPTLDPVSHPTISPQEAGRPGEAIAALGGAANDAAYADLSFSLFMKKAQEHVDTVAASNQMDAAYAQYQDALSKTQNSRDIPDVVQKAHDNLNDISRQWSASPASVSIQQQADGLRPSMQHLGTVRQSDLMGKEFKIGMVQQSDKLAQVYASGDRPAAEAAMGDTIDGGAATGLIGSAEASEYKRQFRIKGQALQADMAIKSPDPQTNINMVNQLRDHPEDFPDLTKEDITDFISKGTSAFETHTNQKEWAEKELTANTIAPAIIKDNTDEQGYFHLDQALKQASHLTPKEEEIVAPYLHNHGALANADLSGKLLKSEDDIEAAISKSKFNDAQKIANSQRDAAEKAGSPWFAQQSKRIDAARREANATYRANYNFDYARQKKEDDMASTAAFNSLVPGVISGQVTSEQLNDALATGKTGSGKLGYANYLKLQNLQTKLEKEPDTKKALSEMYSALSPLPKNASPDTRFEDNVLRENLYDAFTQGVAEKQLKGDDKTKYALELVKPYVAKATADKIDKMFGVVAPQESWEDRMGKFVFGKNYKPNSANGPKQSSQFKDQRRETLRRTVLARTWYFATVGGIINEHLSPCS